MRAELSKLGALILLRVGSVSFRATPFPFSAAVSLRGDIVGLKQPSAMGVQ